MRYKSFCTIVSITFSTFFGVRCEGEDVVLDSFLEMFPRNDGAQIRRLFAAVSKSSVDSTFVSKRYLACVALPSYQVLTRRDFYETVVSSKDKTIAPFRKKVLDKSFGSIMSKRGVNEQVRDFALLSRK